MNLFHDCLKMNVEILDAQITSDFRLGLEKS